MAWTDEMVDQLRAMWAEGLTTGEIGKRLGVSKNSIVGKVHRLGLSGRPSPIKKKEDADSEAAPAAELKTVKEKPTKELKPHKTKVEKAMPEPAAKVDIKAMERESEPQTAAVHTRNGKTMLTDLDNHTCRWPLGDPKDENFHFCGRKVRIGQTYCDEHANIAYVKTNKK